MNIQELTELFDLSTSVDHATAVLQTKTCRQVIEMLQTIPGIIIGDDVGMGKTYIAISAAMCFLDSYPNKKVIIVTPSWLLNAKWYQDIRNFIEKNLHSDRVQLRESDVIEIKQSSGTYISQIANAAKVGKIILIPINVLSSMGWKYEKGFFISCWFKHRCLQGIAREKILKALTSSGPVAISAVGGRKMPRTGKWDRAGPGKPSWSGWTMVPIGAVNICRPGTPFPVRFAGERWPALATSMRTFWSTMSGPRWMFITEP